MTSQVGVKIFAPHVIVCHSYLSSTLSLSLSLTAGASPVLPAPVPVSDASEEPAVCLSVPVSDQLGDRELVGEELDSLLDCVSNQEQVSRRLPAQQTE